MTKQEKIQHFNPSGVGLRNDHFIGLPFDEQDAEVVLLPVPWDVTVSYAAGTAGAPANILQASAQLDLEDPLVPGAWQMGLYMRPVDADWQQRSEDLRSTAEHYIEFLERGGQLSDDTTQREALERINQECLRLKQWVKAQSKALLGAGKLVGIIGGEHSVPLGLLEALDAQYQSFGILLIDAHLDLRKAYEGFTLSHASIFYNALQLPAVQQFTAVAIRDYCPEEVAYTHQHADSVTVFYDHHLQQAAYQAVSWSELCQQIISTLPNQVYVSFDIDGLVPGYCPNTGTPVPGGLDYNQALFLLKTLVDSGRKIIGFDLSEVAGEGHEFDGNVGARLAYRLSNLMGLSQGRL